MHTWSYTCPWRSTAFLLLVVILGLQKSTWTAEPMTVDGHKIPSLCLSIHVCMCMAALLRGVSAELHLLPPTVQLDLAVGVEKLVSSIDSIIDTKMDVPLTTSNNSKLEHPQTQGMPVSSAMNAVQVSLNDEGQKLQLQNHSRNVNNAAITGEGIAQPLVMVSLQAHPPAPETEAEDFARVRS